LLTGRGTPWVRGGICGLATTVGGVGHTLPFLIANFDTAVTVAICVVVAELAVITWFRCKFMDSPPFSATLQANFGGALVFATGILFGGG
jgi:VIT1/CCC1 family predicted Fe2+/Mn2+ transporter